MLRTLVFDLPGSPYRSLLAWAAVKFGDVSASIAERGVEATLELLRDGRACT